MRAEIAEIQARAEGRPRGCSRYATASLCSPVIQSATGVPVNNNLVCEPTRVLSLVQQYLAQDVLSGTARWTPTQGSPQAATISPLLANVYLHALDEQMAQSGYRMVRYADDFVVMCESEEAGGQAALAQVREGVERAGLALHPDKTHVGNCLREGEGFEFLGYRFEGGRRYVRRKSLKGFKDKVRRTTRRSRGVSMNQIVAELDPMLRGWFAHFA